MRLLLLRCSAALLLCVSAPAALIFSENFDDVSSLPGWLIANDSAPPGTTSWFQGNAGLFPAHSGAPNSYIAANFNSAGLGGNIDNWLISPMLILNDGDIVSFYTRGEANPIAADRLEFRLNSGLLLTINPSLSLNGYPSGWTRYWATVAGLGGPTASRFAFRYNVPDTSSNGNYIGIDSVQVTNAIPEPATIVTFGSVALLFALVRKRRQA